MHPNPLVDPLVITRSFDAPPERVFASFTAFPTMRKWMCPAGFTIIDGHCDPRAGGTFEMIMRYHGRSANGWVHQSTPVKNVRGTFIEVDHLKGLWYTITRSDGMPHIVIAEFTSRGDRTDMLFVHDGFASKRSRGDHADGWDGAFQKLAALLSG